MFIIVAYDIVNNKRRTRLAKELENWGCRVQGSVFECDLDEAHAEAMLEALRPFVTAEDDLRVYKLCAGCLQRSVVVNGRDFATDPDFYQV